MKNSQPVNSLSGLCRGCGKPLDRSRTHYCPSCGESVCPECARRNGGVCRRCFTPLERFC